MTKQEAITRLRKLIKPSQETYTHVESISKSWMERVIRVYVVYEGRIEDISRATAIATDYGWHKYHQGIKVGGVDMDVGARIVIELGQVLFGADEDLRCREDFKLRHLWL